MNIFDNIIQSQFNKFTRNSQPTTPSFSTPVAPRAMSYDPQVNTPTPQINTQPIPTGWVFWATMWANPIASPRAKVAMSFWLNEKEMWLLDFAKSKWIDAKTAMSYVQDKRKQEQAQAEQNNIKSQWLLKNASNRTNIFDKAGGAILDFAGGAISEVPNVIWDVWIFANKTMNLNPLNLWLTAIQAGFSDKTYWQLRDEQSAEAERIWNIVKWGKWVVQKYWAYDPNTISSKVWETATDIWASLVWPNKANILKEWTGLIWKYAPKAINLATEGWLIGAKYDVATKWEITPEWVWYWAGWNLIFGAWAKLLWSAYKWATSSLPASMTLWGLINPWKLDVVKKGLMVDEWVATPQDIGKWILDRVKPWNKQEIAEQLIQHAEKTKWAVDEALAAIPTYFKNPEAKKALLQIRNELEWKVWLEDKLSKIDELLAKPDYTLSELNAVKRELDDMYSMYTKTGDPTAWLKAEWLRNVRANIRGFIEKEAEKLWVNVRKLNNETSTARGLADGILRKDSADWVRELLTAFAPSGAGAAIWAGQSIYRWNDPITVLRDALIGGVATKLVTSTTVRTRIASALNKLVPKELSALENYIKSGWKDAIGKKVAEKVIREWRALPARTITKPSDFANPTEKSIITPQTMENAVVQESKKWLSSNIKRPNGNINNTHSNSSNIPVWSKKVQKPIVKPNTIKNESKVNKPKSIVKNPLVEEARKIIEPNKTSLIKDEYKNKLRDMFANKKDWEKLWTVSQVIQNKELLDMMPESVKYMDIFVDSKYLDSIWKQTGWSVFAAYIKWKWNFPWAIKIRANSSPKEIAEEILHAIRYNKWRSLNKPEWYDKVQSIYENSLFEKTAKKWSEYFWK